ncbi:MAG: biopolymer transporter ExbD [Rickettsiales bacterium]|nr:biopolymer transporter ExbD [Rickettsiales bacterium]
MKKFNYRKKKNKIISDINITPFVDVLLVLLIIFMIAAPMMTSSIEITLPDGKNNEKKQEIQPISISIDNEGKIYVNNENIKLIYLKEKLLSYSQQDINIPIFLRADITLDYGRVMKIIKRINDAGFKNVSLATKIQESL